MTSATTKVCVRCKATALAGLLYGSLAIAAAGPGTIDVAVNDGLISLHAESAATDDVLASLAAATGLRLVMQERIPRMVDIDASHVTLSEAISLLLDSSDSYQILMPAQESAAYEDGGTAMLWVFSDGSGSAYTIDYLETVILRGTLADQRAAVRSLAELDTAAAANALALALADGDQRLRSDAMEVLAGMHSEEALQALASALSAEDAHTRARAAASLGTAATGSPHGYLEVALNDEDPQVRAAAVEALGDLGDPLARERLNAALSDADPQVRERAVDILEELDDEALFHVVFPRR